MLVDANLLLYVADQRSTHHEKAHAWFSGALDGHRRVAVPPQTLSALLRILTNPRLTAAPWTPDEAWSFIDGWLGARVVWVPDTTVTTLAILKDLMCRHHITGNLVPDAQLAALALEHGIPICSADSDFARFPEVTWTNPLR